MIPATFVVALVETAGRYANVNQLALGLAVAFSRGFVRDDLGNLVRTAGQAADTFRPAHGFEICQALLFGPELLSGLYQALCHN